MRAIFISYRRDDSEGEAGRLFDDLTAQFGESSVFMDVAGIQAGRDFRKAIDESVASCGVLLAVIGKSWLDIKDESGKRRLDDPADFVRLETASALKRDIPVIPVLVHGAKMPRTDQLPQDLSDLAFRNCCELTHARWNSDVQVLIKSLGAFVDAPPAPASAPPKAVGGGAAAQPAFASIPVSLPTPPAHSTQATSSRGILWAVALFVVAAIVLGGGYLLRPKPAPAVPTHWAEEFIKASEGPSVVGLEAFFDTSVSPYYNLPTASWQDIAKDKKQYFAKFPKVHFTLLGEPRQRALPDGGKIVDIDLDYENTRVDGTISRGKTHQSVELKRIGGQWKIVGIGEQLSK